MQSDETKVLGESGTWVKVELDAQESSCEAIDDTNLEVMAGTCVVRGSVKSLELYESKSQITFDMSGPLRCRLCASPNTEMVDIFHSYRTNELLEKIEYCLRIVVRDTDVLPKRVCRHCLGELELCYRFHKTVAEAEEKLLAFSRQTCGKFETETTFPTSPVCIGQHGGTDYDDIGETFKTPPTLEEVRTTNTTPESSPLLACLKPCSVILVPAEVPNLDDINKHRRNSSDTKLTDWGPKSAPEINQPAANDLEVSEITADKSQSNASETLSLQLWETFEEQKNLEIRGLGHMRKIGAFKCSLCPKLFVNKESLKRHTRIHTGPGHTMKKEAFKCSSCPKLFRNKGSLTKHNKIHTGLGLHSCDFCEKKFVAKSDRDRHHLVHTGEKPFKCSLCEKAFAQPQTLRGHMATVHSDIRNYPCFLCDKSFKTSKVRKRHMSVHRDEKLTKLWQCDHCKTNYRRENHLLCHVRFCEKRFRNQ